MGTKKIAVFFLIFYLIFMPAFAAFEGGGGQIVSAADSAASSVIHRGDNIKAIYLSQSYLRDKEKIQYLLDIIEKTGINAIVIDLKDNKLVNDQNLKNIISEFKKRGSYTIGRLVVFQDSSFARANPDCAIKKRDGSFWHSGRAAWKRYWLDPACPKVVEYTIYVAKVGINMGFDEINFDYIRFPSDGNMKDMVYPYWDKKISKYEVMENFFKKLHNELKLYNPKTNLSVDIFGEAFFNKSKNGIPGEPGIGQRLDILAKYFDVICPMAYPSHYRPGTFGLSDPNFFPYETYYRTLKPGLAYLDKINSGVKVRPWIQDFSISNIYGGKKLIYGQQEVCAQIKASADLGINGFMLWNARSNHTIAPCYGY